MNTFGGLSPFASCETGHQVVRPVLVTLSALPSQRVPPQLPRHQTSQETAQGQKARGTDWGLGYKLPIPIYRWLPAYLLGLVERGPFFPYLPTPPPSL